MLSFILLLIFFLSLQGYLTSSLKISFLYASLLSLFIIGIIAFILLRFFTQPLDDLMDILKRLTVGHSRKEPLIDSKDEFGHFAKAISEMDTQLRNKIEEVSKEKDYLQTILKGMAEGVLVVDDKNHIIMINDALRILFSLSTEVVDKTPLEFIRNAELEGAIQEAIQDNKSSSFELTLPSFLGKTFEVNVVGILPSPEEGPKEEEISFLETDIFFFCSASFSKSKTSSISSDRQSFSLLRWNSLDSIFESVKRSSTIFANRSACFWMTCRN